jgi:hypothetical protein
MIEIMTGLPDNAIGISASGQVTALDYQERIVPAIEAVLARHDKVRILYQLTDGFSGFEAGAMWEDAKVGLGHRTAWERIALVTDVHWLRVATQAFGFVMPGELRVYANAQLQEARDWIAG